eukprot:678432-Prymnesium_polylepis.1
MPKRKHWKQNAPAHNARRKAPAQMLIILVTTQSRRTHRSRTSRTARATSVGHASRSVDS